MALKFYKVINGLKALFKSSDRDSFNDPLGDATFDNLSQAAADAGVTKDSIVITQATEADTNEFGGKFLPGTNVMLVNGQTFVDASNIVQGVYTKLVNGDLVFCAPYGTFLDTDTVRFARVYQATASNGIVVPVSKSVPASSTYNDYTLKLIPPTQNKDYTIPHDGDTFDDMGVYTVQPTASDGTTILITEYLAGLGFQTLKDVAFCVYRAHNQITDWFQWTVKSSDSGTTLVRSKGLYLPGIKEILYKTLVNLRDSNKLVPGRYYKIIDYYPTVSISTMTDGYYTLQDRGYLKTGDEEKKDNVMISPYWQIIVQALTKNTLDENAIAFNGGASGDGQICRIKYCLDPESGKTPWSASNSTGGIYYMEDQYHNSATYDFKNLKFKNVNKADPSCITSSSIIGSLYTGGSPVLTTSHETAWTFEDLNGNDLSSTGDCIDCHIETPEPQRVVFISAHMVGCRALNVSVDSTMYAKTTLKHIVLDRSEKCYVTVTESGAEHIDILGKNNIIVCKSGFVYSNIQSADNVIFAGTEIKNVRMNGYYGGPNTLLAWSFQHITFTDYCANVKILGVTKTTTSSGDSYSLGGYMLYGMFNSARELTLKTNGKNFTNFTFMPGDYKATFKTPSNVNIGDQGSYTFIGGNYNDSTSPAEPSGLWNKTVELERAGSINLLYAPTTSKFTLL